MSTLRMFGTLEDIVSALEGYSVHWRDIMSTSGDTMLYVRKLIDTSRLFYMENLDILNIPWCTRDFPRNVLDTY